MQTTNKHGKSYLVKNKQRILQLLGLAKRAGELVTGESKVIQAIRQRQVHYVFMAGDGGSATLKKVTDKCRFYQVPCCTKVTRQELSQAIGQSRSIIGVKQPGFSKQFQQLIQINNEGE